MSGVRVLVGTRKGAFVLTSDGKRKDWDISGPHFAGWEIYHLKGSPVDPNRLYVSQSSGWFGQQIQRSSDGGKTWEPVGNKFVYDGVPGTHQWYDGTPHPWEFKRVWHLEPSLTDPDTVYAGVEDAALFRSTDGGQTWEELSGLRGHGSGPALAAGRRRDVPAHDSARSEQIPNGSIIAISAAGASGPTTPARRGGRSTADSSPNTFPTRTAEVGHCVHRIAMHRVAPGRVVHAEALGRHAQRRRRRLVARGQRQLADRLRLRDRCARARAGDDLRRPDQERLRAFPHRWETAGVSQPDRRQRLGATHQGLPQRDCYVNVLRDAMAVDSLDSSAACISAPPAGRFTCRPTPEITGPRSSAICRPWFPSRSRHCHDSSRAPASSADAGAHVDGEVKLDVEGPATRARSSTPRKPAIRCCAGRSATTSRSCAGRS